MAAITLEVPDGLAAKIDELLKRMPDFLPQVLELATYEKGVTPKQPSMRHRVFEEMLDFLASGPSSQQIIAHKVSVHTQDRSVNFWIRTEKRDSLKPKTPNSTLSSLWTIS